LRRVARAWSVVRNSPGTGNLAVLATQGVNSTVDTPQSSSNQQLKHSYLSESRGGPGPTWLSEGGWAGGGGGENRGRRRRPARMQPAGAPQAREGAHRRDRGTLAFRGHDCERPWPRAKTVAAGEDRGRWADTDVCPTTLGTCGWLRGRPRRTRRSGATRPISLRQPVAGSHG